MYQASGGERAVDIEQADGIGVDTVSEGSRGRHGVCEVIVSVFELISESVKFDKLEKR